MRKSHIKAPMGVPCRRAARRAPRATRRSARVNAFCNYHQLRRAISYANFGKLRFRSEEDQQIWDECSRLLASCIIFFNATILSELWAQKVAVVDTAGAEALKQISPVAWQHVNVHGCYEFTKRPQPIDLPDIVRHLAQHFIAPEAESGTTTGSRGDG